MAEIGQIFNIVLFQPMVNALMLLYSVIGNYGIAIILFTIAIRLLLYPLTVKQIKGATAMQDFQKSEKWQDLQKKYKDDKQKLQQEQMKLYQEMGINPLASCLPTLLQLPILIGIYQAISRCLAVTPLQMTNLQAELYPFINAAKLIPVNNQFLWFNLSQPERWQPAFLPFLTYGIPIMAIIVVITTYMQSKLMTPPAQPGDQGAGMTQAMNLYMPFFMGYLALTFNAGLSLYLIVTNVVSIAQYAAMGKLNWDAIIPFRKPAPKIAASSSSKSKKPTQTATQKTAQKPAQKALPKAKGKE